jgi:ribosomal protein S3
MLKVKDYVNQLHQDFALRELVAKEAPRAGVSRLKSSAFPAK